MDILANAIFCAAVVAGLAHITKRDCDEAAERAVAESRRRFNEEVARSGERVKREIAYSKALGEIKSTAEPNDYGLMQINKVNFRRFTDIGINPMTDEGKYKSRSNNAL